MTKLFYGVIAEFTTNKIYFQNFKIIHVPKDQNRIKNDLFL